MTGLPQRPVHTALGAVVALVLFGGGFALGSNAKVASSSATGAAGSTGAAVTRGGAGAAGAGGAAANRGLVNGQILAINSDSITISMRQGGQNGASATTTTALVLV